MIRTKRRPFGLPDMAALAALCALIIGAAAYLVHRSDQSVPAVGPTAESRTYASAQTMADLIGCGRDSTPIATTGVNAISCDSGYLVMTTYLNNDARDASIERLRDTLNGFPLTAVIGHQWVATCIERDDHIARYPCEAVQAELGGRIEQLP